MSIGDFPEGLSQAVLVGIMLVGRLGVFRGPVALWRACKDVPVAEGRPPVQRHSQGGPGLGWRSGLGWFGLVWAGSGLAWFGLVSGWSGLLCACLGWRGQGSQARKGRLSQQTAAAAASVHGGRLAACVFNMQCDAARHNATRRNATRRHATPRNATRRHPTPPDATRRHAPLRTAPRTAQRTAQCTAQRTDRIIIQYMALHMYFAYQRSSSSSSSSSSG